MIGRADILHVDLAQADVAPPTGDQPVFIVFWWRSLLLGARLYLAEELPLAPAQYASVLGELGAVQLMSRLPELGGPPRAGFDAAPRYAVPPEALSAVDDLMGRLEAVAAEPPCAAGDLTVVVCTRDRPHSLRGCLERLCVQTSAPGEIIVVDNAKDRSAEAVCNQFPAVTYVHEPRPGLSVARNAGVRASRGALIAFTDDDAVPHPNWTSEIVRAFRDPTVDAVTGAVLPAALDTFAQCFFQFQMGGLGARYHPLLFDRAFFELTCRKAAQVWRIGAGANMAFRRAVFSKVGLFDARLGAGASGCSEDSELWYRILAIGGRCYFESRAVVFHAHRETWPALCAQMRAYMRGHVYALVIQADRYGHRGNLRRIWGQLPAYFVRQFAAAIWKGDWPRLQIWLNEVAGWTQGLVFLASPNRMRRAKDRPRSVEHAVSPAV
jgi:glycosyltransferase involved in cell wall biosynthesis